VLIGRIVRVGPEGRNSVGQREPGSHAVTMRLPPAKAELIGREEIAVTYPRYLRVRPCQSPAPIPAPSPLALPEPPAPSRRERQAVVTKAEYDQLEDGMSQAAAEAVIGAPGTEISSVVMPAVEGVMEETRTVMLQWQNEDASNMNAMFQNDRLVSKAQFDLP
jgi:hypothetical protein